MRQLTKDNIKDFLYTYNDLHDANIKSVNYNSEYSEIEIIFEALRWTEKTYLENNQPTKTQVVMLFKDISKLEMHELYYWDFIFKVVIQSSEVGNTEIFTFADDNESPNISITCKHISFNDIQLK